MMNKLKLALFLSFFCLSTGLFAQPTTTAPAQPAPPKVDHSYKPMTLKLNDDGSKYIRFITWHQFWVTATQNNPGTTNVKGEAIDGTNGSKAWSTDIALRRSRFLAYAQISPRFLILTHWGINNQSFNTGATGQNGSNTTGYNNGGKKPHLFIHDAWTEFQVAKDKLYIGAGLHYWNGMSRMSNASTLNFMTIDAPIFNWPTIEATDQFARQFGVFAKGQLGRLDYRLALNKPFASGGAPTAVGRGAAANVLTETWAQAGYVNYMFGDKENNKLPFMVGSYLGGKKVFNIGVGFYNQKGASLFKSTTNTDSLYQDHRVLSADLFYDRPLNKAKGTAVSVYAAFYNMNFGTNYLRNIGILNLHTNATPTTTSFNGAGNAQPTIGTGNIGYVQAGYMLPKLKNSTSFMPYATFTYKDFERLSDPSTQVGLGLNYFVSGHNAKISLEYQTRPIYKTDTAGAIVRDGSKGELILQTHIFL